MPKRERGTGERGKGEAGKRVERELLHQLKKAAKPQERLGLKWYLGTFGPGRRWAAIPYVMRGREAMLPKLHPPGATWDRVEGCFVLSPLPGSLDRFLGWVAARRDAARGVDGASLELNRLLRKHRL